MITHPVTLRIVPVVLTVAVCAAWVWLSVRTSDCLRVITRGTALYSRRTVLLIKIVATVVAAPNVAGAAASFGANWFLDGFLGGVVVLLAVLDKAVEISPATPPQMPSSYSESWQQYLGLRKQLVIYALILIGLVVASFLTAVALGTRLTEHASTVLFWSVSCLATLTFVGYAYNTWKFTYWPCPRCGCRFRGPFSWALPKKCSHCGLPQWREDSDLPSSATPLPGR
jgi:hypothetical protein